MVEQVICHGMVMKSTQVGDYDLRLVLLTKERGKLVAFARGARRAKGQLSGCCLPFSYGEFALREGKDAYQLLGGEILRSFYEISEDVEATCYGCYFLELADFFSRENIDAAECLNLIYVTLKALLKKQIPNGLIRSIFELKMLVIQGEYPQMFECVSCGESNAAYFSTQHSGLLCRKCSQNVPDCVELDNSTIYTMQYIITAKLEKLYTFVVKDYVEEELAFVLKRYFARHIEKEFASLEVLKGIS